MDNNIESWLFKAGIPTYKTWLEIDLPTPAQTQIEIADKVPENVGWIYGMSIQSDGKSPYDASKPLISATDAYLLWLTLKYATSDFVDTWRLSDLNFNPSLGVRQQPNNYAPCSIPMGTDWRKSKIINTTGIVGKTIWLDVYFIDVATYKNLRNSNTIWFEGKKSPLSETGM